MSTGKTGESFLAQAKGAASNRRGDKEREDRSPLNNLTNTLHRNHSGM